MSKQLNNKTFWSQRVMLLPMHGVFIPPYGSMGGYLVYCMYICFFCLYVWLHISQQRKKIGEWNFACAFDYYLDRSSPILVNFGSWGVMVGALFLGCMHRCTGAMQWLPATLSGQLELGAVAWWGSGNWGRWSRVRPYGGICVLQACWHTCFKCCFLARVNIQ